MAKKRAPKNQAAEPVVANAAATGVPAKETPIQNGLGDALGMPSNVMGFGTGFSTQLSQTGTIFKNLRYYLISNFRQILSQAYVELGLIQTIVDVPVDDGLRGGVEIKSKQLDENQIEELQASVDRDDDLRVAGQAAKWNRLFGGAGILIITDQDPESPLDLDAIDTDSPLEFKAVDMWELYWDQQNLEGFDLDDLEDDFEFYSYYGRKVHKTRVMMLKGLEAPSFIRPRLRGWGFSVVETLVRSINQYLKATDLSFEVLDEFKLDVYKIKNLVTTLMSPNGDNKVKQRVQMANWQKNYQNAIVMDSEDDFDHKQLSFSGLAETMGGIRMQVAADMRMPLTKLFGISAAGFNSGEDDIEVYNSMVEAQVRGKLKYDILRMLEIKCQKLFGFIPDDMTIAFKPLRVMSAEQEENVKTAKFNRALAAKQAGEITRFEFREVINKGNLLDVTLDNVDDKLNPDDPDVAALVAGELEAGANKPDSQDGKAKGPKAAGGISEDKQSKLNPPEAPKVKNQSLERTTLKEKVLSFARREMTFLEKHGLRNSVDYDKAAYTVDGGDDQYLEGRKAFYEDPSDPSLYVRAREASLKAFGRENWKFIVWWYTKEGGKFHGERK